MTAVCNPWNGHVIDKGADNRMGNWSYITMRGKKKKHLTFITLYKISDITLVEPCMEAITGARDSMNVFAQQMQILRQEGTTPCSLAKLCMKKLRALIVTKFNTAQHEIVLSLDANEDMSETTANSLRVLMTDLGLHDALEYANPGLERTSTMKGKRRVIDYIFITQGLMEWTKQAGDLATGENGMDNDDHPSWYLDLDARGILSTNFTIIYNMGQNQRKLWFTEKVAVNLYVKILLQLCKDNEIEKRMNKLNTIKTQAWSPENSRTYNKLDQHITRLMHRAEKKCKKSLPKTFMWSDDLHEAGSQRSYWNALKQSLLPHRNISKRTLDIKRKMDRIPLHQEKPVEEINMELRKAKKTMKHIRQNHMEYRKNHLKRKAAAMDKDKGKDPNKTSTLIQLIRHEKNIQMWRTGKRHMGRERGRGLTEIMVPVNPNEIPTNETREWRRERATSTR
jgi:hypothetical protein